MHILLAAALGFIFALAPIFADGESFEMPEGSDTVIGNLGYTKVSAEESLLDIARQLNLGYDQIILANPGVNRWIPDEGTRVVVPHLYVLPGSARRGIVLNIAELRLYFYPKPLKGEPRVVITHPVSIGRMEWRTPLGLTSVVSKERDPPWRPPESIKQEHALDGEVLPEIIPGGDPENPLGHFALRLGIPSYMIHGVNEQKAFGIGMQVTHGCIRMYPEDIEKLFNSVAVGTPVLIVNEPIKLGQRAGRILLEIHQPLEEDEDRTATLAPQVQPSEVLEFVARRLPRAAQFDPALVYEVARRGDGIPTEINRW